MKCFPDNPILRFSFIIYFFHRKFYGQLVGYELCDSFIPLQVDVADQNSHSRHSYLHFISDFCSHLSFAFRTVELFLIIF